MSSLLGTVEAARALSVGWVESSPSLGAGRSRDSSTRVLADTAFRRRRCPM